MACLYVLSVRHFCTSAVHAVCQAELCILYSTSCSHVFTVVKNVLLKCEGRGCVCRGNYVEKQAYLFVNDAKVSV